MNIDYTAMLTPIVGAEGFSVNDEDLLCYAYDATRQSYIPAVVVWPETTHQVSAIMEQASLHGIPVVPRGAGTGFSGGSLPIHGGMVLAMTRMNRIISIDKANMLAEVEPGVVTAELDRACAKVGLYYPPDPASLETSTIGGNVAEGSGGPRAVKYGVTRDYVLGLEGVLANGQIIRTGSRTTKCVVGYDLTRLFVGSEGTLCIITRLFLRLLPRPEAINTMLVAFPDVANAAQTVADIIAGGIIPTTLEFMDRSTLDCLNSQTDMHFESHIGAMLIIEVDGPRILLDSQMEQIQHICDTHGAIQCDIADHDRERAQLWAARRAVSPSLHAMGKHKVNEDIVVPRSKVPFILQEIQGISRRVGLPIVTFGHAGDGNIHVNIMADHMDSQMEQKIEGIVQDIFRATLLAGGTISGEHGIGITKKAYISMELNRATLETMRSIKKALDPQNILNPGKMLPFEETLYREREE